MTGAPRPPSDSMIGGNGVSSILNQISVGHAPPTELSENSESDEDESDAESSSGSSGEENEEGGRFPQPWLKRGNDGEDDHHGRTGCEY